MGVTYKVEGTTLKSALHSWETVGIDIIVPKGVTLIESFAIKGPSDNSKLIMPDTVKKIKAYSIQGKFKEIVFSKNLEEFEWDACHCLSCKSPLIIPSKIKSLPGCAFYFATFPKIVLPEGLEYLGERVFMGNSLLTKINLPSTLKTIDDRAFEDCEQLENIILPPKIESIGKRAFYNTNVKGIIIIPKSIKEIGKDAFPNKECIFYIEGDGENIKTHDWHHPQAKIYFDYHKTPVNDLLKGKTSKKESSNISLDINISDELYNRYLKALDGDGYEMYYLGYCYEYGKGVTKDMKRALYWYSEATIEKSGAGIYSLAKCYEEGKGVKKNLTKAFELYKKGADLHHDNSLCSLGSCYYEGKGTTQNYELAFKYYLESAKLNNYAAIYNVGLCYEYGHGVKKNLKKALEYYQQAYNNGSQAALKKIKTLK